MIASDARAPAEIEYVELRYGRPPSMSLYFDVRLRNLHPEARWFLLPRSLAEWRDIGGSGGVNSAEIFEYGPAGAHVVRLGDFYGNGGFAAMLLPAEADITLRRFVIRTTQDPRPEQQVTIPLVIAREVKIGNEAAETWFGGNALSAKNADVMADQGRMSNTHSSSDGKEMKVTLVDEERLTIDVVVPPQR